jgi:tungstate transport system substrate-binding protein
LDLVVVFEGDPLLNPYAIIMVNPEKHPHVNQTGAEQLVEWITTPRGQKLIEDYRVNRHVLFHLFEGSSNCQLTLLVADNGGGCANMPLFVG